MKEIPLTQGLVARIDDGDYESLAAFRWSAHRSGGSVVYARRRTLLGECLPTRHITMHRLLIPGVEVDHRNGDGLDNRRSNLRVATHAENGANQRVPVNSTTGFKGVSKRRDSKNWAARIRIAGRLVHLGMFETAESAARAYDHCAREQYGAFAALNFPTASEQSAHRVEIGAS